MDLAEPAVAGRERDARFMGRVFTPAERRRILEAAVPAIDLWKTWTAKETALKAVRKVRGAVPFAHRAFEVTMEGPHDGFVCFEDLAVRVRWEVSPDYLHCLGFGPLAEATAADGDVESGFSRIETAVVDDAQALAGTLSATERASVHSVASERARLLARTLLGRRGLHDAEIVRPRRSAGWGAPIVARHGRPVEGFDVSLSHDGRFVAAAVTGPRSMQNAECGLSNGG